MQCWCATERSTFYDAENDHPLWILCISPPVIDLLSSGALRNWQKLANMLRWNEALDITMHKRCVSMIRLNICDLWFCHVQCDVSSASPPFNILCKHATFRRTLAVASHQHFSQGSEVEFRHRAVRKKKKLKIINLTLDVDFSRGH